MKITGGTGGTGIVAERKSIWNLGVSAQLHFKKIDNCIHCFQDCIDDIVYLNLNNCTLSEAEMQEAKRRQELEAQLLAEEQWIITALKKVREQRTQLRLERIEMERMKEKLLKEKAAKLKIKTENEAMECEENAQLPDLTSQPKMLERIELERMKEKLLKEKAAKIELKTENEAMTPPDLTSQSKMLERIELEMMKEKLLKEKAAQIKIEIKNEVMKCEENDQPPDLTSQPKIVSVEIIEFE